MRSTQAACGPQRAARFGQVDDTLSVTQVASIELSGQLVGDIGAMYERELVPKNELLAVQVALVSLDGRWLRANGVICTLLGYSEAQLQTTTFMALTHPEDREVGKQLIEFVQGQAREKQCDRLYWHTQETNQTAQRLYDWIAEKPGVIEYRMALPA